MSREDERNRRENTACQAVREVYASLATIEIERACIGRTECCRFRLTGEVPYVTRGEALVAARAYRATGRRSLPPPAPDGACPMLSKTGRCLIYADRPFACRTHFCRAAGGPFPRKSVAPLIQQLEQIDASLNGSGSIMLPKALSELISH